MSTSCPNVVVGHPDLRLAIHIDRQAGFPPKARGNDWVDGLTGCHSHVSEQRFLREISTLIEIDCLSAQRFLTPFEMTVDA